MARDAIEAEAARWFTRLQAAELPLDETIEWQRWMALDPRHAEAFQRLEETWHAFSVLPRPALLTRETMEPDSYDGSVSISEWNEQKRRSSAHRRSFVFAMAASVVVVMVGIGAVWSQRSTGVEVLETRVGENRTVTLADGSRLSMGGRTRVEVKLGSARREVTLARGEALFGVAKDATRPFSVRAGSATVTAVGTEFNVRRSEDQVTVSVLEGRVMVQPMRAIVPVPWLEEVTPVVTRGDSKPLDAGHRTMVDRTGMGATAQLPDMSVATAWQLGRLAFEDESLRYVVDVVNRYSGKPIVIGDAEIEDVRVSGTVVGDHIDGWVASLDTAFGIRAVQEPDRIVLHRR
jgi:transmembrane sensor